jgi:hypothetical protein
MTAVPLAIDLVCAAPPFNSSPAAVFIPLGGGGLWSAMESMAIALPQFSNCFDDGRP